MKNLYILMSFITLSNPIFSQLKPTNPKKNFPVKEVQNEVKFLRTEGNKIIDPCGNPILLMGVCYEIDENMNTNKVTEDINLIAKTGANSIRFLFSAKKMVENENLRNSLIKAIKQAAEYRIISVLAANDLRCRADSSNVFIERIIKFYKLEKIGSLFNVLSPYIIINYADGALRTNYPNNGGGKPIYNQKYSAAIHQLRALGFKVPIMIDAPDCGTDYETMLSMGSNFKNTDSLHNIIMSFHTDFNNNLIDSEDNLNFVLDNMIGQNRFPIVISALKSYRKAEKPCGTPIAYKKLLETATLNEIGYFAYAWRHSSCPKSNILLPNKTMTEFGNDIVEKNEYYALKKAEKPSYFYEDSCHCVGMDFKAPKPYTSTANDTTKSMKKPMHLSNSSTDSALVYLSYTLLDSVCILKNKSLKPIVVSISDSQNHVYLKDQLVNAKSAFKSETIYFPIYLEYTITVTVNNNSFKHTTKKKNFN